MSRRLLVPAVMFGVIGIGSVVLQRWVAETMTAAAVLSVIWAGIIGLGFLAYARHRRELLAPIAGALVLGAAIGGLSYWYFSVRDTEVDEDVAVAQSRAGGAQARLAPWLQTHPRHAGAGTVVDVTATRARPGALSIRKCA